MARGHRRRRARRAARHVRERLSDAIASTGDLEDTAPRLTHPDCHLGNVIESAAGPVVIDWEGAGQGPPLAALGWLLYTATADVTRVEDVIAGYTRHVPLSDRDLARLPDAIRVRPLVIAVRSFRDSIKARQPSLAQGLWSRYDAAEPLADRVRAIAGSS